MNLETMAAHHPGEALAPWHYAAPPLGPHDCLVRVLSTGICHSDIHMIDNDWNASRYPLVPGHEVVGEVLDRGNEVQHLQQGERVGIGWQASACLTCTDCVAGNENLCHKGQWLIEHGYGGFASHLVIDSRFCFPLPTNLSTEYAGPLLCAGITVYAALRYAGMTSGQNIGIIGMGGLGHLAVQFAHKLGNQVTVFTTSKDKIEEAIKMGANRAILTKDGQPTEPMNEGLHILISTISHQQAWDTYLDLLDSDGTLTFVGVPQESLQISIGKLLDKRRRIMGNPIGGRALIQDMLTTADQLQVSPQIETFPLKEVNRAIQKIRDNSIRYRAVLIPSS